MDETWITLAEAETEKRREIRDLTLINWTLTGVFWVTALVFYLTATRGPLWFRAVFALIFALIPVAIFVLAKSLRPRVFETRRVPLRMRIGNDGLEVQYLGRAPTLVPWNGLDSKLTIFEARYPGHESRRWLLLGNDSIYQGIRLEAGTQDCVVKAANNHGLKGQARVIAARFPKRELVWTVYLRRA